MTDACGIRPTNTRDLTGAEPVLVEASALDLAGCDRFEIVFGLYEHERVGLRFETWPATVQNQVGRIIAEWQTRNPTRALLAQTCAVQLRSCVMVLHHHAKG